MGLVHSKAYYIIWPVSRWQLLKQEVPHWRLNSKKANCPVEQTKQRADLCIEDTVYSESNSQSSWQSDYRVIVESPNVHGMEIAKLQ